MNAQHLAKHGAFTLRVAAWFDVAQPGVIAAAAIAGGNVKVVRIVRAWAESDPTTVMIGLRMVEGEKDFLAARIGNVRICRDRELGNVGDTISKRAARNNEIEIKLSVCGVIRVERHPEQALLTGNSETIQGKERRWTKRAGGEIENSNCTILLHDKEPLEISRLS